MSGAAEGVALLPCPFCGNDGSGPVEDALHVVHSELRWRPAYDSYTVQCDRCTATMGYSDSEDEAVTAWNTRTTPPARTYAEGGSDEDVARIIDHSAWLWHDRWMNEADTETMAGRAANLRKDAKGHVARSLAMAAQIRGLLSQGEKA